MKITDAADIALRDVPPTQENYVLRGAIQLIVMRYRRRDCASIKAADIADHMRGIGVETESTYEWLRLAWIKTLAASGVLAPVPGFEEVWTPPAPEPEPMPLAALWGD